MLLFKSHRRNCIFLPIKFGRIFIRLVQICSPIILFFWLLRINSKTLKNSKVGEIGFDFILEFVEVQRVISWIKYKSWITANIMPLDTEYLKFHLLRRKFILCLKYGILDCAVNLPEIDFVLVFICKGTPVIPNFLAAFA